MRKFIGAAFLSVSLLAAGVVPAHASETVLPDGANSSDTSAIEAFTCESNAQMWMPMPLADNPISATDLKYSLYRWRVLDLSETEIVSDVSDPSTGGWGGFTWEHTTPLVAGSTYTVILEGTGDSDEPTRFEYSMTVMDDEYSGEGSGTPEDPYLVASVSDLNEMRCVQGAYWKLVEDIDFSTEDNSWIPFALGYEKRWSGVIDGDGHILSGAEFGNPQQRYSSLLGRTTSTVVEDLILRDFKVTGFNHTALLSSESRNSTTFRDISIESGLVNNYGSVAGLLVADCNYGCGIIGNDIQGEIIARTTGWAEHSSSTVHTRNMTAIGGLMGKLSGSNGGYITDNVLDVDISIRPENDFSTIASELAYSFDHEQFINSIGGLMGSSDEDLVVLNNTANVKLHIETYDMATQIGGAVGENETPVSGLNLTSEIEIVSLYTPESEPSENIQEVAGAIGKADDISISRSKIDATISISHANGSNNFFGLDIEPYGYKVNRLGGVYGDYDDDTADFLNEVHAEIHVSGAADATRIGGYVGNYDNTNGLNPTQVIATGSIEVESDFASMIGGFVGSLNTYGILAGSSVISAVTMDLTYSDLGSTHFGAVAGDLNRPATNLPSHFYWDSSINDYENPVGHNYLPATTSQLQSRAFLTDAGFDMVNSWDLNGGYPELRPGFYGPGAGDDGSGDEGVQVGDSLVFVKGNREFTTAGGELELYGEGLRGVTLSVAGTPLYFKYVTDTSGFALIPAGLSPGAYALVATTTTGDQTLQGAFTILGDGSNSTMKVWTKRIPGDTEAKFYAKNIIGEGKVRFVLNGREIAWINAVDNTDPKLRSANGAYYLVRTVSLKTGKNVLEIYVDGVREKRVVYTR